MYAVGNAGLTARPFKPFTGSESGVAFNPSGHLLAVSLQDSDRIRMFSVASNGSLTSIGTPTPTGSEAGRDRVQPQREAAGGGKPGR